MIARPNREDIDRTMMAMRAYREPVQAMENEGQYVRTQLPFTETTDDLMRNSMAYLYGQDEIGNASAMDREAYRNLLYQRYVDMMRGKQ